MSFAKMWRCRDCSLKAYNENKPDACSGCEGSRFERMPGPQPTAAPSPAPNGRSKCRSCKAPIVFALTGTGRLMPVDVEPHADGNLVLELGDEIRVRPATAEERTHALPLLAALRPATKLFRAHFATCPHADQHRRIRASGDRVRVVVKGGGR
jgi:hypothetical protein